MNKLSHLTIVLLTLFLPNLHAQKSFMKLGSIPKEDLQMEVYLPDTSASAVILGDFGVSKFSYTADKGWVIMHSRHVRIKIFDKEAFDWADFNLSLYKGKGGGHEDLASLKAFTVNIEDGKIVKHKLDRNDVFNESYDKNHELYKFTMPNVKENSILDVSYTLELPYLFTLQAWQFQYDIPVRKSQYHVFIPEYFYYKNWVNGYLYVKKESEKRRESFQYIQSGKIDALGSGRYESGGTVNFEVQVTHWTYDIQKVPAFIREPFITTPSDYLSRLEFELLKIEVPGQVYKNFTQDWAEINKDMLDDDDFGKQLNNTAHLKDIISGIQLVTSDPTKQMMMAYEAIKRHMVWDKRYRMYPNTSIRKAFNDGGGNSSDINLNLVSLLKGLGMDANPVLVSTRSNGKIRPGQVILTQFNHVIACVEIEGEMHVLDAIDPYCPYFMLPPNTLNGKGLMLSRKGFDWVDLYSSLPWSEKVYCNLQLNNDLEFEGSIVQKQENFAALSNRKEIKDQANEEEYRQELEQDMEGLLIDELRITNLDSLYEPLNIEAEVVLQDKVTEGGEFLYFNPILFDRVDENKFKNDEREYPIDFTYPVTKSYTYAIKLPDGYTVQEVPEPLRMVLPDDGGSFTYIVKAVGSQLSVRYLYSINKTVFPTPAYPEIKKFYEVMVASQSEQVVLKQID